VREITIETLATPGLVALQSVYVKSSDQPGAVTMSTLMDRYRARRNAARRRQAIERALDASPSRAVRAELMDIANR
jgi:hypothetical protein